MKSARDRLDSAQTASTFADIARLLESEESKDERVRRVLESLERLVPYESCALLLRPSTGDEVVLIPDAPVSTRAAFKSSLSGMLHAMEGNADIEPSRADTGRLVLPVIGADQIIGVLQLERPDAYALHHVQLLSTVASHLGAYLAMVELRDRERRAQEVLRESEQRLLMLADTLETQVRVRTKELEQRNTEVLRQSEQLRELSHRLIQIQDQERRHIARELHDSAGQVLTALGMNLARVIEQSKQCAPHLTREAEEGQHLVQQLSQEIRTTSYLLHPPLLDEMGLPEALRWYIQGLKERSRLDITLTIAEDFGRLSDEMELVIFRLVQECLTNVHRHSGSKSAVIRITRDSDNVSLEVKDDGNGISPQRLREIQSQGSGLGIRGMRERVRQLYGNMNMESKAGTTVSFRFPVPKTGIQKETV